MGSKLGAFLRVLGGGLSPQAFQAQTQQFAAEQADIRGQAGEQRAEQRGIEQLGVKQAMSSAGILATAYHKETDPNKKDLYRQEYKRLAENIDPKYQKVFVNSTASAFLADTSEKSKGPTEDLWLSGQDDTRITVRRDSPELDKLLAKGYISAPTQKEEAGPGGFTKKTDSEIQDRLLKSGLAKDRLKVIRQGFKPEFTEVGTRAANKFTALTEKFGIKPGKASKKSLSEYTAFARNTLGNLNQHIRDRTGAVMNINETGRLKAEMPDIGEGIFDGDSATQFKSKMEGALAQLEAAEDRLLFAKANGLGVDPEDFSKELPLSDFEGLPSPPAEVNVKLWHKMTPADRRELVKLMNAKRAR